MRRRIEQDDLLSLLAEIAASLGADMSGYQVPSERLSDWLDDLDEPAVTDPAERRLRVLEAVQAGMGELG